MGAGFIALSSWARIPFYPVPFTLQTFAIFAIALLQPPRVALASSLFYLLLCSFTNPLWILGKCGGYMIAFPISAYLVSRSENKILGLLSGHLIVYTLGFLWLSFYFGCKIALINGVLFFLPSDTLKAFLAYKLAKK